MATARIRRNKTAGKAQAAGDVSKSLSDRLYAEQSETNAIWCALHIARRGLQTTAWENDTTLSALHGTMCDIEERLEAVTNNLDLIFLDLGKVERQATKQPQRGQVAANG